MKLNVYEVNPLDDFDKEVGRLTRKKKFFTLPKQIKELTIKAAKGEFEGTLIKHSDNPTPYDVYKLRLPNPDADAGKSDGYRVIYMVVTQDKIVVLLTIYYKKETESVSDTYISGLIDGYWLNDSNDDEEIEI